MKETEYVQRIGSDSNSLASNIDVVKFALNGAEFAGAKVPPTIYSQLEGLKSSAGGTGTNQIKWDDFKDTPNSLWKDIEPFFKLRDDVTKLIDLQTFVGKILGSLSASVDKLLYGALGSILGPVIGSFRKGIEEGRTILLQKEETTGKDPESDIISPGYLPLYKAANNLTAKVAAVTTNFTSRAVVSCWDNLKLDIDTKINSILQALHHLFQCRPLLRHTKGNVRTSRIRADIQKTPPKKTQLLALLHKDTIATNKNRPLLTKPGDYMNIRGLSDGPKSKPQSLINARAAGTIEMSNQAFSVAMEEIEAPPTVEQPNPFDAFLALVPGDSKKLFEGVAVQGVMGATAMRNLAKDAVVGSVMQTG